MFQSSVWLVEVLYLLQLKLNSIVDVPLIVQTTIPNFLRFQSSVNLTELWNLRKFGIVVWKISGTSTIEFDFNWRRYDII